jgi:hypothetical protein
MMMMVHKILVAVVVAAATLHVIEGFTSQSVIP